jgi:peptide/nickel transport system substrate-binding protein
MEGTNSGDIILRTASYSRLTRLNQDLGLDPDLATEWSSNDANDEWTFVLNEDATFSNTDGRSVLAEDVEATIEMIMENPDSAAAGNLGPFDSIEIEDDHRFTISLTESDLLYPKKIAEADSRFVILPKNIIEDRRDEITETDFGSGPFTLTNYESGNEVSFEGRDNYHITDSEGNTLPYVDEYTWKLVVDPTAQLNALTGQRVDALQFTVPSQAAQLEQTDGIETISRPSAGFINFVLNTTVENENGERPFADPKVRKAMKHAVDLQEMRSAASNLLEVTNHHPVTPAHEFYPDFEPGLEFGVESQPDEAERLLEEAGYGDGLQLPTMYYSPDNSPSRGPTSVLFQEQMSEVGIEFEIQRLSNDVWLSDYWNEDGVWYASGYAGRLIDSTVANLALESDAPWNSARWSNEEYDEAHARMNSASTREEFGEALAEAMRIHHLEGGWIVTGVEVLQSAANDYVQNVTPLPTESVDYHYNDWLTSDAPEGP